MGQHNEGSAERQFPRPVMESSPGDVDMEDLSEEEILREESSLIEDWLKRTMAEAERNSNVADVDRDFSLKSAGLDRDALLTRGFQAYQIDGLYRMLYAQTAGYHYALNGAYGFQLDEQDLENVSRIVKLLSSRTQNFGTEPLIRGDEEEDEEERPDQDGRKKLSRVVAAAANTELLAYSQLRVQRDQLQRKLTLSREKRKKLEDEVGSLIALTKKRNERMMQSDNEIEEMRGKVTDLEGEKRRLLYELREARHSLAAGEGVRGGAKGKDARRETCSSSARNEAARESRVERRTQDAATPSGSSPPRRDTEERLAAAEKRNAEYRDETRILARRSKMLGELYEKEASESAALRVRLEEIMEQNESPGGVPPSSGHRKLPLAAVPTTDSSREVAAERGLARATAENDKLRAVVANLTTRDVERRELEQKHEGLKDLLKLKDTENAELRKELDARDYQQRLQAERCSALAENYEALRLLPNAKDADIAQLKLEMEKLMASLAAGEAQVRALEKICEERKAVISSREREIEWLRKAQDVSKATVSRLSLQGDRLMSLQKELDETRALVTAKDTELERMNEAREGQTLMKTRLEALQKELDATKHLGDSKDAEIKKLNEDLDEATLNSLQHIEKAAKLDAEAQGSEERVTDLQRQIQDLNNALTEGKSREDALRFSLEELEAVRTEEAKMSSGPSAKQINVELKQALTLTQQKYAHLEANYDALEAELTFLKTRKGEVFKLHAMLAESQADLRKKGDDSSRLLGELNSLRREAEKFRAAKQVENTELLRALRRLRDAEDVQAKAREQLAASQREVVELRRDVSASGAMLAAAQLELSHVKSQISSKEAELTDLRLAANDAKKEEDGRLRELIRRRTIAMKKSITDVTAIHEAVQQTKEGGKETLRSPLKGAGEQLRTKVMAEDFSVTHTGSVGEGVQEEDLKVDAAFEILDQLDREAEATANTVKDAVSNATQALMEEIRVKSASIQELLQEKELWKEKIVSYSLNLSALADLLWTVWNKAVLAAKMSSEVSAQAAVQAENLWKSLSDEYSSRCALSLEFVDVLKAQEEITAMAKNQVADGMAMKTEMDELTDHISVEFAEDLPEGLVSNYRRLIPYLQSHLKRSAPPGAIYSARPLPQGLVSSDMRNLLEAQKKITTWQRALEMELERLKAEVHAEQAGRRWKDKYTKDVVQKCLSLKAKLGKLADTQYISRPVQTSWTDMWSLFNDTVAYEQPDIPDHFSTSWERLLQNSKWIEPLSEKTARQTITSIYAAKIKDDHASLRSNKSPHEMPEFVYLYFQEQFGRSPRGEEKLKEFMATVQANKTHPEVNKFGLAAGMIRDGDSALSGPVLQSQVERIPATHVVMQMPINVTRPRLPLGELQLSHRDFSSTEDAWRRDPTAGCPPVSCPTSRSCNGIHLDESDGSSVIGVTRDNSASINIFCSPRICNPKISTPRTRGAGVVLAPLAETALGSPRWRAKQARMPFVKDTKLLGMTDAELAHPLAENLVEWKALYDSPSFTLEDLPHPMVNPQLAIWKVVGHNVRWLRGEGFQTEEATNTVFNRAGVQDTLDQLSTQWFLDSAGNVDLGVPITGKQLPQLHALLHQACEAIDVEVPYMYVRDSPYCRAYLWCPKFKRPSVIFNSALFDILDPFELQVVISQQLVAFKYPKYRLLAMAWTVLMLAPSLLEQGNRGGGGAAAAASDPVPEFNVGRIKPQFNLRELERRRERAVAVAVVSKGQWPICSTVANDLDRWIRFLDLVGDRAAYFVARSVTTVVSANMKMAAGSHTLARQLDVGALLEQGRQLDAAVHAKQLHDAFRLGGFPRPVNLASHSAPADEGVGPAVSLVGPTGTLGVELRTLDLLKTSHSLVVLRARELQRWAREICRRPTRPAVAHPSPPHSSA